MSCERVKKMPAVRHIYRLSELPNLTKRRLDTIRSVFLGSMKEFGLKAMAAEAAGVTIQLAEGLLEQDNKFRELVDHAHQVWIDRQEQAALVATAQHVTGKIF